MQHVEPNRPALNVALSEPGNSVYVSRLRRSIHPRMDRPLMDEKSPQIRLAQPRGTVLTNMAVAALMIAALYFGREVFVPVALAVLLSFALAPFVIRLHSWRVPRTISVLVVVFIGFSIIFSLGGLMVSQATHLAAKLPDYQRTFATIYILMPPYRVHQVLF